MRSANLRTRALLIASVFAGLVVIFSVMLSTQIDREKENIIEINTQMVLDALQVLDEGLYPVIAELWQGELAGRVALSRTEERSADARLSQVLEVLLQDFDRIEAGIYFFELDEFIGYAYPAIPSPKPAFGPPPRSYNIIRDQVRLSIASEQDRTELHGFDPAVFPLGTSPVFIDGQAVAAIWARTHIERELAATGNVTTALIYMTLVVSLLGFGIALTVSWKTKVQIDRMREGLDRIKKDNAHRLDEPRGVLGTVSHYINDLVEALIQAQHRTRKLERDLYQQDKMASLGSLVAGAAHEINTPAAIIKTRVQMWERGLRKLRTGESPGSALSEESFRIVHHELDRIAKLVKRLLVFARPVSDDFETLDVNLLLNEIARNLNRTLHGEIVVHEGANVTITADRHALEQVFTNTMKNGLEAGGESARVQISTAADPEFISVFIDDTGPGIPEELKDRIFDPFFTTKEEGTGLGLAISREIIRAHGGNICFEPAPAGGSRCSITLPLIRKTTTLPQIAG